MYKPFLIGDLEGGPTTPWVLGTSQSPWEPILQALLPETKSLLCQRH